MTATYLDVVYQARGAARRLLTCRDPEVLLSGPAGTGKSRAALEKINGVALKYPGIRVLIVRKVRDTLGASVLKTWRELVIPDALANQSVVFYGGSAQQPAQYIYENGSQIHLGGMDRASKIMSTEYDVIYVAEATELDLSDWEALTTRLRNNRMPYQQLIADTNPGPPTHWLKQRCDAGTTTLLESRHEDNPVLFDDQGEVTERGRDYLAKLDALTGVTYLRLRKGLWVAAEGMVHDNWDPALHVIPRFEIPDDWPRDLAIDWGYTNPLVVQWWAEDHDGRLYRYRELYRTGLLASEAGEIVKAYPERIRRAVADHDSGDREAFRRTSGIRTHPATKDVTVGLQTMNERLAPAGDGRPRLFLLENSLISVDRTLLEAGLPTCTEQEIPGYVWDRSTAARREKETPVKENDHGCDAARYECMARRRRHRTNVGAA